jgi:hypothetical protein
MPEINRMIFIDRIEEITGMLWINTMLLTIIRNNSRMQWINGMSGMMKEQCNGECKENHKV